MEGMSRWNLALVHRLLMAERAGKDFNSNPSCQGSKQRLQQHN